MKYFALALVLFLAACSKSFDKISPQTTTVNPKTSSIDEKQSCSFGMTEFSLTKRPAGSGDAFKGRPRTSSGSGTTTSGASVIYLDFNGQLVSGTMWNVYGDINCAPAILTADEISNIYQRVVTDYTPFNVTVTTDENVYNSANPGKRMRVIVTDSWEWYGQAGGVAYLNSFTWGNNTPCFVFSSLLGYNTKKIAEACSHEAGHTLGLRHQSAYDASGTKISEYNYGQGTSEIGWAPIMGAAYYENLSLWHNGPNSISSTTMQDDIAIISGVIGFQNDDYSNSISNAAALSTSKTGIINSNNDVDFFSVNLSITKQVSVVPQNVGANDDGGNLDIVLSVYDSQGVLLSTINDPSVLNAVTTLAPGSYYLAVSTADNQYTTRYGMLSKYNISVN